MEIEVLQAEKSRREPVVKQLFEKTVEEDAKLKQGLAMYQRLGLFFEHAEANRIVVQFTQIDAKNPSREFSFRITIDPITDRYIGEFYRWNSLFWKMYCVFCCCNEEVTSLNEMVAELNEFGDLYTTTFSVLLWLRVWLRRIHPGWWLQGCWSGIRRQLRSNELVNCGRRKRWRRRFIPWW